MNRGLTALEQACVEAVVRAHWPSLRLDDLQVIRRENTGVGRFVDLFDPLEQSVPDGVYEADGRVVEMEGLRFGLDFAITVQGGRLDMMEIVTADAAGWDGVERSWRMGAPSEGDAGAPAAAGSAARAPAAEGFAEARPPAPPPPTTGAGLRASDTPAEPGRYAFLLLVGTRLFERAVLERVYDVLAARPAWAPELWGYSEAPDREITDREDVTAWAEDEPNEHLLTLGRAGGRVPYEASLDLGWRSFLEIRVPQPLDAEAETLFELLFELGRTTRADFGWASLRAGHKPPFQDAAARAAYVREAHMQVTPLSYWKGGPGGLAERTWIGPAYLARIDPGLFTTFSGVVRRFDEGVGVDLGPEPWALRGARRDELWREAMAHFGAAGVFATAHVTPEGMITFEPGRVSRPPAVR